MANSEDALRPRDFPSSLQWLQLARQDVLNLYPDICFREFVVRHKLFGRSLVYISDPEMVHQILGTKAHFFGLSSLQRRVLQPALGDGLILAEGERWADQRRIALKIIARAEVTRQDSDCFAEARLDDLADELLHGVRYQGRPGHEVPDIFPLIQAATLDILASYLFQLDRSIATGSIVTAISDYLRRTQQFDVWDLLGVMSSISSPKMRAVQDIAHEFDERIIELVNELRDPLLEETSWAPIAKRDFVLSLLSGFETSALSIAWALGYLSQCDRSQHEFMSAGDSVLSTRERPDRHEQTYTTRFLSEVLRLHPPLPFLARVVQQECVIGPEILRRGELILISPYVIQRHERLWPEPNAFDPDRIGVLNHEAYIPFGAGVRRCVGMSLGWYVIQKVLGGLARRLRFSSSGSLPRPRGGLSLRPATPLRINFERRERGHTVNQASVSEANEAFRVTVSR